MCEVRHSLYFMDIMFVTNKQVKLSFNKIMVSPDIIYCSISKEMSFMSFKLVVVVVSLFEARARDFDAVFNSTAVPVFLLFLKL
jgi:hypothetical protein